MKKNLMAGLLASSFLVFSLNSCTALPDIEKGIKDIAKTNLPSESVQTLDDGVMAKEGAEPQIPEELKETEDTNAVNVKFEINQSVFDEKIKTVKIIFKGDVNHKIITLSKEINKGEIKGILPALADITVEGLNEQAEQQIKVSKFLKINPQTNPQINIQKTSDNTKWLISGDNDIEISDKAEDEIIGASISAGSKITVTPAYPGWVSQKNYGPNKAWSTVLQARANIKQSSNWVDIEIKKESGVFTSSGLLAVKANNKYVAYKNFGKNTSIIYNGFSMNNLNDGTNTVEPFIYSYSEKMLLSVGAIQIKAENNINSIVENIRIKSKKADTNAKKLNFIYDGMVVLAYDKSVQNALIKKAPKISPYIKLFNFIHNNGIPSAEAIVYSFAKNPLCAQIALTDLIISVIPVVSQVSAWVNFAFDKAFDQQHTFYRLLQKATPLLHTDIFFVDKYVNYMNSDEYRKIVAEFNQQLDNCL